MKALRNLALLLVACASAALLSWTALGGWHLPEIGPRQNDYYNLLVAGFQKGSLALDIEVPALLRDAKDPLEVVRTHPGIGPHDVSVYRGHYYTYYGVVPTVVLFWPFHLLTGHDLPVPVGMLALALGALLVTTWLWARVVRDNFPHASIVTEAGGAAVLGLAAGQLVLMRRISIWEPSIIAGHFFLVVAVAASYLALSGRRRNLWLALAGLSIGLAAGSRPTQVVAALGLVPLVLATPESTGQKGFCRLVRPCLAAGIPLCAVGFMLLYYNWARFGNPLDLGLSHQLSSWNEAKTKHFQAAFIPFNFWLYFLSVPQWGRYFPFVHPIVRPPYPLGYWGHEYVYGALLLSPVIWWGSAIWLLHKHIAEPLFWFALVLLTIAVPTMLVIFSFDASAARYATDFMPWWTWLALLAWCAVEASVRNAPVRAVVTTIFGATALASCVTAFCCSAELHEILEQNDPDSFLTLSRLFNGPTAVWERASGFRSGPVAMDVVFAERPLQSLEPLVVSGVEYQRDYAYVFYQNEHKVRLGFRHPGDAPIESGDIEIVPGRKYPVEISYGSLYPPEGHPSFSGWPHAEVSSLKHWASIVFDGRVVVGDMANASEASPGTIEFGKDDRSGFCGRRFAGVVSNVRRLGWTHSFGEVAGHGDIEIKFETSHAELPLPLPLIESGQQGSADIVGVKAAPKGASPTLVYESYGAGIWESGPIPPGPGDVQSLRVRLGPELGLAADSPIGVLSRSVVVWNGTVPVWWQRSPLPVVRKGPPSLFFNGVNSSSVAKGFEGRILSAKRLGPAPEWRPGPVSHLRLQLGGRGFAMEPLVETGSARHGDALCVEWLPGGLARLTYDHWGEALRASPAFAFDAKEFRTLRIQMPSLSRLGEASGGNGRLDVSVDDKSLWGTDVPYFGAGPGEVTVGRNALGSSVAAAELTSVVLDVEQEP